MIRSTWNTSSIAKTKENIPTCSETSSAASDSIAFSENWEEPMNWWSWNSTENTDTQCGKNKQDFSLTNGGQCSTGALPETTKRPLWAKRLHSNTKLYKFNLPISLHYINKTISSSIKFLTNLPQLYPDHIEKHKIIESQK